MKKLYFEYDYKVEFDQEIFDHQYQLRCIPRDGTRQKIMQIEYTLSPPSKASRINDGFGNPTYTGSCNAPHTAFSFQVKGEILRDDSLDQGIETCYPIYKYSTPLTRASEEIKRFALENKKETDYDTCLELMHRVHAYMTYQSGITNNQTTAKEAFLLQKGVCQDYAHILISALRSLNIPSRYVAGIMEGEGATHAWVDAYAGDHFIHLDPTNDRIVNEGYIKLSHGRDFSDCIIDKGIFKYHFLPVQKMSVKVKVEEIDD